MSAPLTITGFTYLRSLGQFSLGNSYVYREDTTQREVHVMISRQQQSLDDFIDAFEDALGGGQPDLIRFAGLTDRDRPYLITDFLAAEPAADPAAQREAQPAAASGSEPAALDDETVLTNRSEVDDATRLSAPKRAPAPGSAPAEDVTVVSPRALPSMQVIEDPVHAPALILDESQRRYSPRTVAPQTAAARPTTPLFSEGSTSSRPQPRSVRAQEQRRARGILIAVSASILFSTVAVITTVAWLIAR